MVILGNLPSQLRVLDSSQQLYAPLFLASYCGSLHTLSLIFSQKTPPSFYDAIFSPFLFSSETLLRSSTGPLKLNSALLPPLFLFSFFSFPFISDLPSQWSLLQPPFLCHTPSAATFSACGTPLQKVPPHVKVPLQLQKARLIPYGH